MAKSGRPPRIHITALGSSAIQEIARLGAGDMKGLVALAQRGAGPAFKVTASDRMIASREDDLKGGRSDDAERIRETERLLADDTIAAIVTIRGGAWFARLLDRIDFDVLRRRRRTLHIFGFSEMTPLIAIAGRYPKVVGLYDLGPAFLYAGRKGHVLRNIHQFARAIDLPDAQREAFAAGYAMAGYPDAFSAFFTEVASIVNGQGCPRVPRGRLLSGSLPASKKITITGGNLSLLCPLPASKHAGAIETRGKWLAIEDLDEDPGPIDRMMSALKLAGLFDRAEGIILGDFHKDDKDLSAAAFEILKHHLPPRRRTPVISIRNFGHIYPIAPLPLHREVTLRCARKGRGRPEVSIDIPWKQWVTRGRVRGGSPRGARAKG